MFDKIVRVLGNGFSVQRPKGIIRKYEQLDARDELNAACSLANRISEKQKQRMDLHGALEDLLIEEDGDERRHIETATSAQIAEGRETSQVKRNGN